jgi:hypothetical protein
MTEDLRTLREHLSDARLYAGDAPAAGAHPAAWRAALLVRYPARPRRRPREAAPSAIWRLLLLVALPVALAATVTALFLAGIDLTPRLALPGHGSGFLAQPQAAPAYVWYGLAAAGALLTFLVRGRLPRLLPLDW